MQRFRETLALILIGLLSFHAFGVTVLTKLLAGPGHAPLPMLAFWKEALLALILVTAFIEWLRDRKFLHITFDALDWLILAFGLLSVIVTFVFGHKNPGLFALGARYDLVPLVTFLCLRRVPWSGAFVKRSLQILLWIGCCIVGYGLLTLVLPQSFFTALGYSDLHSLYVPDGPLAAFQQLGGLAIRRMQSVLSGPNQLGLWLLLPWSIACIRYSLRNRFDVVGLAPLLIIAAGILGSFSRSAWIGAAVMFLVCMLRCPPGALMRKTGWSAIGLGIVGLLAIVLLRPEIALRAASSRDHLLRPMAAIQTVIAHPLGMGLGSAGPASNRVSDACVTLEEGADASWAKDRPDLCVFVGQTQVQPAGRACNCPLLTENWYLQIAVETGVLGGLLFLALTVMVLLRLWDRSFTFFLMFLGMSVAGLFLHAWEDAAVAYALWLLVAVTLQARHAQSAS